MTEKSGFEFRQGQIIFLLYIVQTGSGTQPPSCLIIPGIKGQRLEAKHSFPPSAEFKDV